MKIDLISELNKKAELNKKDTEENVEVYKLCTTHWQNERGLHAKKSLILQKRLSSGYQTLYEDAEMDCECTIESIINLYDCKDGLYFIKIVNIGRDYETGYVDSYDYQLVPLEQYQSKLSGNTLERAIRKAQNNLNGPLKSCHPKITKQS